MMINLEKRFNKLVKISMIQLKIWNLRNMFLLRQEVNWNLWQKKEKFK